MTADIEPVYVECDHLLTLYSTGLFTHYQINSDKAQYFFVCSGLHRYIHPIERQLESYLNPHHIHLHNWWSRGGRKTQLPCQRLYQILCSENPWQTRIPMPHRTDTDWQLDWLAGWLMFTEQPHIFQPETYRALAMTWERDSCFPTPPFLFLVSCEMWSMVAKNSTAE